MNQALNAFAQAALNEELAQYMAYMRKNNNVDSPEVEEQAVAAHAAGMLNDPQTYAAQLLIAAGTAMLRESQLARINGITCQWQEMLEEYDIVLMQEHTWAINKLRDAIAADITTQIAIGAWLKEPV
jgi:hypothetical protein